MLGKILTLYFHEIVRPEIYLKLKLGTGKKITPIIALLRRKLKKKISRCNLTGKN